MCCLYISQVVADKDSFLREMNDLSTRLSSQGQDLVQKIAVSW